MRIGVLGTGTIASVVVRGIAGDGHQITVSERGARHSHALRDDFENVRIGANQTVLDQSDVILLGLMAGAAPDILGRLNFRPDQQIITFMAGATLNEADALVAPARAIAIMMPFPNIAQGGSPIMMQGDSSLVEEIFGARNPIFPLGSASEMAAYLCAQAVLSPVARIIGDAADWLASRVENPTQGESFLRALIASNLSATDTGSLIEALNTPGGYNQRLRIHMEHSGMGRALTSGLDELE